jgi:hypothetical protein
MMMHPLQIYPFFQALLNWSLPLMTHCQKLKTLIHLFLGPASSSRLPLLPQLPQLLLLGLRKVSLFRFQKRVFIKVLDYMMLTKVLDHLPAKRKNALVIPLSHQLFLPL